MRMLLDCCFEFSCRHPFQGYWSSSSWVCSLVQSRCILDCSHDYRRLAKEDAEKITIPHIVLASNGEDEAVVKEYAEVLSGPGKVGEVETYGTMHHGWMGGRADLKNADNLKEYERG